MSDELSRPPEQTAVHTTPATTLEGDGESGNAEAAELENENAPGTETVPGTETAAAIKDAAEPEPEEAAEAETEGAADAEAQRGLPKGSIAAVGERLGQRVAQASEAAGDRVAHAGEVAAARMAHVGETAGERVAHVGEAAGQKVILAGEAAEGTIADAQTRAAAAKQRISRRAGELAERVRHSTPPPVREKGSRAVEVVKKHPRETAVGSAVIGFVAAVRRRAKRTRGGEKGE